MRVIGLDLSMNSTGYAVIEVDDDDTVTLIKTGLIKAKSKDNHSVKLRRQFEVIEGLINEYIIEETDAVVKEALHYGRPHTMAILAKVHGVVDLLFDDINEYKATTIKMLIAGNGKAKKEEVEAGVRRIMDLDGIEFQTDDESDALAVGLTYTVLEGVKE